LRSASDGRPRFSREQNPPAPGPPANPNLISLSPHHLARTEAAAGGLARGRRWPVTVKGGTARHTAAACSSLPSFLCSFLFFVFVPSSGSGGAVNPVAGRDRRREGRRRPARSRGRLLPPFCLLFLPLLLFPSPATKQDPESPAMVAAGEVAAPPLAPSPARAFTLGERAAVERLSGGASGPNRTAATGRRAHGSPCLSAQRAPCNAGGGGGSGDGGRSHGRSFSPGPLLLYFSDLGLGFQFCTVKSIWDRFLCSFLFPNKIHCLAWLWYH
jgi:hypothetical protein